MISMSKPIEQEDEFLRLALDFYKKQDKKIEESKKEGIEKGREEGWEKGIKEGVEKDKVEVAKNLFKMGADIEFTSKATTLPISKVKELSKEK